MITTEISPASATPDGEPPAAICIPVAASTDGPVLPDVGADPAGQGGDELPTALDPAWCARHGFAARPGQALALRRPGSPTVVLGGVGNGVPVETGRWRRWAAAVVRAAGEGGTARLLLPAGLVGEDAEAVGAAVAEGALLGGYRFDEFRTSPKPAPPDRVEVWSGGAGAEAAADSRLREAMATGIARGAAAARAVSWARDLANTPASDLTPTQLAERAVERLAGSPELRVEVWDESRIAGERLGGLLGVAKGSSQPPRLVQVNYDPPASQPSKSHDADDGPPRHVVLVGKGITFDSGGLSLKTAEGMKAMKTDMSGAAIVLGVMSALAETGVGVRVTAIAPMAENMTGGSAVKPGDVLRARNGTTIEVLDTDAEGRLVLADALSLAVELSPDVIIDVATLTGSAMVALGPAVAPLYGTDPSLVEALRAAGARSGEQLWPMPMPEEYGEHLDSDVADLKNIGRPTQAGSVVAAIFLSRFIGDVPWAHLDIAGTGRSAESAGIISKGATAFGLRALLEYLRNLG